MLWIYLAGLAIIAVFVYNFVGSYREMRRQYPAALATIDEDRPSILEAVFSSFLYGLFCSLFGTMAGLVLFLVGTLLSLQFVDTEPELIRSSSLTAIQDNSTISGSFFLGSGSIDGVMVYNYYVDSGNGAYSLETVKAEQAKIKYSDDVRVETYRPHSTNEFLLSDVFFSDEADKTYVFYVPEGSIANNYTLDAK